MHGGLLVLGGFFPPPPPPLPARESRGPGSLRFGCPRRGGSCKARAAHRSQGNVPVHGRRALVSPPPVCLRVLTVGPSLGCPRGAMWVAPCPPPWVGLRGPLLDGPAYAGWAGLSAVWGRCGLPPPLCRPALWLGLFLGAVLCCAGAWSPLLDGPASAGWAGLPTVRGCMGSLLLLACPGPRSLLGGLCLRAGTLRLGFAGSPLSSRLRLYSRRSRLPPPLLIVGEGDG